MTDPKLTTPVPASAPVSAARSSRWRLVLTSLASTVGGIIIMNHNAAPPR